MRRVTRDIDPAEADDLLVRVPRACLSWVAGDGPRVAPVDVRRTGDTVEVRARVGEPLPGAGEVVLLIDEGVAFFDLRGGSWRGTILDASPEGWQPLLVARSNAWDYGRLREVTS